MKWHVSSWRSNLKTGFRQAAKKLPSRSSADSLEGVARLAERSTGLSRSRLVISSVTFPKNRTSVVRRFDVRRADTPEGDPILQLIEKRSKTSNEYRFYRYAEIRQTASGVSFVPSIYLTKCYWLNNPDDYRTFFVLEHLKECGLPDLSEVTAHQLAARMSLVSRLPVEQLGWAQRAENQLTPELLEQFIAAAVAGGYVEALITKDALKEIERDWHRVSDLTLPMVPCHNDLHINNLGLRYREGRKEYVFFDWEKFGLNYVGADLHHFINKGIAEPDLAPFAGLLHKRYRDIVCDVHSVENRIVDLGALSYSLFRSMSRSVMHKNNKKRRMQIDHVIALFRRIKETLGLYLGYVLDYIPLSV
jgi:hypothetical protein